MTVLWVDKISFFITAIARKVISGVVILNNYHGKQNYVPVNLKKFQILGFTGKF